MNYKIAIMPVLALLVLVTILVLGLPIEIFQAPDLSYTETDDRVTVANHGNVLAVYHKPGNTFIEFWYEGANILGGFSSSPTTSWGVTHPGGSGLSLPHQQSEIVARVRGTSGRIIVEQ